MNFFIKTYGCQMNEYDSQRLRELFLSKGYTELNGYQDADVVVVNTCAIREKATHKVYSELGRIAKFKEEMNRDGRYMIVVLTGCVAGVEKEKIFQKSGIVDIIIGPQSYGFIMDEIDIVKTKVKEKEYKTGEKKLVVPNKSKFINIELKAERKFDFLKEEGRSFDGVSAFVSIQEGCNKFCTYCVVPNTRGREVQRPVEDVLNEVKNLAQNGCKEVFLLGQNVTSYEAEHNGRSYKINDLIDEISKIDEIKRIRYTTSHPINTTDEIVAVHKTNQKLMPYLHFPVQSGSDEILKKMNRKYNREQYFEYIAKFREACPEIVFSSDFIVGFPTETEQNFGDTLGLVRKVFYGAQSFSFKYSPRPNTPAARMDGQIDAATASMRLDRLQALLEEQRSEFNKSCEGKVFEVLFDNKNANEELQASGRSQYLQIVIVDCKSTKEKYELFGKIRKVKITKSEGQVLFGEII